MPRKITYNEVKDDIASMEGLELLTTEGQYKNANTKIKIRHHGKDIDHIIETTYTSIKKKRHCTVCAESASHHHTGFVDEKAKAYKKMLGNKYTMLEDYVAAKKPCKIKHNKCGYEWSPTPNRIITAFKAGKEPCPYCNGKINITEDNFYDLLAKNNTHQFRSVKFTRYDEPVETVCMKGHKEYHNVQTLLHRNTYCKQCYDEDVAGKYHMLSNEEVQQKLDDRFGKGYFTLLEYNGFDHPMKIRHNSQDCNYYIWETSPSTIFDKRRESTGCIKCLNNIAKGDTKWFINRVYDLAGDDFIVLGEYIDSHTPIKMQHNVDDCHQVFETTPNGFISAGVRCPLDSHSHGENWIRQYLNDRGYDSKPEKTYPDLADVSKLRYDFYLNGYNILIEYDGPQHDVKNKDKSHWDNFDYDLLHKHDLMKNEYAKKHNIPLIRIPYTVVGQEAVNNYLDEKLAKFIK